MLKKLCSFVAVVAMLVTTTAVPTMAEDSIYKQFYVATTGSDSADGSEAHPFKTIAKAKEEVARISDDMKGDVIVNIEKGTYFLDDTLVFTTADSGKNGHRIIYKGEDMPNISGGVKVGSFAPSELPGIYKAPVDGVSMMREMYVNGTKAYVASLNRSVKAIGYYQDPRTIYEYDGMVMSKADIGLYENAEDIEFSWLVNWKYSTALVDKIIPDPDNDDRLIVLMQQSWWEYLGKRGDDGFCGKPYRAFEIKNALELLDEPGEFYYNKKTKYVYYMPRKGEELDTAEVIAPRVDKLLKFDGDDANSRVENIRFEGLQFSGAAFYGVDEGGMENAQAQMCSRTNDIPWYMTSGISLARTNNIQFENNYFYGFGAACIDLIDAVDNTYIGTNAFSDIGDAAIDIGKHYEGATSDSTGVGYHDMSVIPPADAGECNLVDGKVKTATSYRDGFNSLSGSKTWFDKSDEEFSGSWSSDPNAPAEGRLSWVRYDFENRYNISSVKLGFEDSIPKDKRCGYEILLSNDRDFAEGTYEVVATQETPASHIEDYEINPSGKYRYLMIRTIKPTELSISRVWAFTKDRKPFTTGVMTYNNTIYNNYITRTGETVYSGGGIGVIYTRGLKIQNNEICNIPYSGIMIGWGWSNIDDSCQDNRIERNYVHDTNVLLDDGGGIYTLSQQKNSVVSENYVANVVTGRAGIYSDSGTSEFTERDNVIENCVDNYFIWTTTVKNNKYLNTYGYVPQHTNNGNNCTVEEIHRYTPGNDPGFVCKIKENAGTNDASVPVRALVPDLPLHIPDGRNAGNNLEEGEIDNIVRYLKETIGYMLEQSHFGDDYGDYPMEYYYSLEDALEEVTAYKNNDQYTAVLKARELINKAAKAVKRIPLNDLIEYCESEISSAVISNDRTVPNSVTKETLERFRSRLGDVKKQSAGADAETERDLLLSLEDSNREFQRSRLTSNVAYLYVEGIVDETIDNDNKTIVITMPTNLDLTACNYKVSCTGTSECAIFEDTINLSKPFDLPIYNPNTKEYTYYRVSVAIANDNDWETIWDTQTQMLWDKGDSKLLLPYAFAYINGKYYGNAETQEVVFTPNGNRLNTIKLIYGAGKVDGFDYNSKSNTDDHLRLEILDGKASLYKQEQGTSVLIKDNINIDIDFGNTNTVGIKAVTELDGFYLYSIYANDSIVGLFLSDKRYQAGYTGICTEQCSVVVK